MYVFLDGNVNMQTFEFNLTNKKIKNLRLDLLNEPCVLEIKSLELLNNNSSINLLPFISTNACAENDGKLFFDTNDSQVYLENINNEVFSNATTLKVNIEVTFLGNKALCECIKIKDYLLQESEKELKSFKMELKKIYNSKSWQLIKTIRFILNLFTKK